MKADAARTSATPAFLSHYSLMSFESSNSFLAAYLTKMLQFKATASRNPSSVPS